MNTRFDPEELRSANFSPNLNTLQFTKTVSKSDKWNKANSSKVNITTVCPTVQQHLAQTVVPIHKTTHTIRIPEIHAQEEVMDVQGVQTHLNY